MPLISADTAPDAADTPANATRLYAILARQARTAVVFRRGPSRQVQLIRWNLRDDTFEHGQWFKGRIYERRCDLSPSGKHLVYFAATHRAPHGTWTAVSRPPYFSALVLWPKGDAWGGGGLFQDEHTLLLNHAPAPDGTWPLAPGFTPPPRLQVRSLGPSAGRGEDEPLQGLLRERDGWQLVDAGKGGRGSVRAKTLFTFSRPQVMARPGPSGPSLQQRLHAVGPENDAFYAFSHRVVDAEGAVLADLGRSDWADWEGGDVVFARAGRLYRLRKNRIATYAAQGDAALQLLHDFRAARFTELAPSAQALKW
ncbi:hypothetical protein IMZ29_10380 [Achromobacter sp. GG226]|uniref:hypothetical protein n=1 Tax=Verticiella alkaliphila TaxID=2779529 RepID=UPI001C0BBD64|nr:hypothetical protein [Verticiella sp. GG226]MBU4610923.1 hypothetical protein [Verticiella sp. GG226]